MWIVQFISPVNKTTVASCEGPFMTHDLALDYIDQRDHMLDFEAVATSLVAPRFAPDQSYKTA